MEFHEVVFEALMERALKSEMLYLDYVGNNARLVVSAFGMKITIARINVRELRKLKVTSDGF